MKVGITAAFDSGKTLFTKMLHSHLKNSEIISLDDLRYEVDEILCDRMEAAEKAGDFNAMIKFGTDDVLESGMINLLLKERSNKVLSCGKIPLAEGSGLQSFDYWEECFKVYIKRNNEARARTSKLADVFNSGNFKVFGLDGVQNISHQQLDAMANNDNYFAGIKSDEIVENNSDNENDLDKEAYRIAMKINDLHL